MQSLVSIVIIGFNSRKFLGTCFDAIFAQTYPALELIFIDNNSSDDSVAWTQEAYGDRLKVVQNAENIGYTGAANQGMEMARGEYIVITNPDIIYTPEYFEKCVARMEGDAKIAALTGKVIKYSFEEGHPTGVIDTVGLCIFRSRRVIDDGQGLPDDGRFDEDAADGGASTEVSLGGRQVFGISGACPMYRRTALNDAKLTLSDGSAEILDGNFFMYKEDVDLSWRLTLLGWKCWYFSEAVAYHGRGTGVAKRFTTGEMLEQRGGLSPFQKTYSFRNQRLMQVKNELWGNFWHDVIWIAGREIGSLVYVTFREPYIWKSVVEFFKLLPATLAKRRVLMARVEERWRERGGLRAAAREMQQWFVGKSRYVK